MNISVYARLRLISRRFDFDAFLQPNLQSATLFPLLSLTFRPLSLVGVCCHFLATSEAGDAVRAGRTFLGPSRNCLRFMRDVIVPIGLYFDISYAARVPGIVFLSSFAVGK